MSEDVPHRYQVHSSTSIPRRTPVIRLTRPQFLVPDSRRAALATIFLPTVFAVFVCSNYSSFNALSYNRILAIRFRHAPCWFPKADLQIHILWLDQPPLILHGVTVVGVE